MSQNGQVSNPFTRYTFADLTGRQTLKWQAYPADVLPLWIAEMDTELAEPVRDAVLTAVRRGEVGYPWGTAYPSALADFAADRWDWSVDPTTMRHTTDVLTGLAHVVQYLTDDDSVLVINTPVYPPILALPRATGRGARLVSLTETGRLDLTALEAVLGQICADHRQPVVVLCNPLNPTGVAPARAELEELAALAATHRAQVVADEIHAPLVYPGAVFTPYLSVAGAERAYAVHSASKAFNLPGLKAALIVPGSSAVDDLTAKLPHVLDFSASSIGILAHAVALAEGRDWLAAHLIGLVENRDLLAGLLRDRLPTIGFRPPEATYLAWLDCRELGLPTDPAEVLLERARVAVNSGPTFGPGGEGHVRLNFATAPTILAEAVERIHRAVAV